MPNTHLVVAQGLIDGVNRVFLAGMPYVPRSTAYVLNGRIHSQDTVGSGTGYVESNPDLGEITVDVAPLEGDVVLIYFEDRLVAPAPEVQAIVGVVSTPVIRGVVQTPAPNQITGIVKGKT